MATKRNRSSLKKTRNARKSMKKSRNRNHSWTTAIEAAETELKRTGSVTKAHTALRSQALLNARKIFGSVGKTGGSI